MIVSCRFPASRTKALAVVAVIASFGSPAPTKAQTVTDFSGKTLSIAIGYGTGGTYHSYASLFADHLGRFLPGQPKIIVQSMPGAGGIRVLNFAGRMMPADGTQLLVPPDTLVVTQITAKENAQYDARKFHYLGTANQQNSLLVVKRAAAASLDDVRARELNLGHSGSGSNGHLIPVLAREALGIKAKLIAGYDGSRTIILAMERGELDGSVFAWDTWVQAVPQWFQGDKPVAVALFQMGHTPDPAVAKVPLMRTLVKPADIPLVDLFDTISLVGRSLALPPGVKPELVAQYRTAFESMLSDKQFQDAAAARHMRLFTVKGADLQSAIATAIDRADASLIARSNAITEE